MVFSSAFKQYWNSDDEFCSLPSAGKRDRHSPWISVDEGERWDLDSVDIWSLCDRS